MTSQDKESAIVEYALSLSPRHIFRVALNILPSFFRRMEQKLENFSDVEINLEKLTFVTPITILPLAAILMSYKEKGCHFTVREPIDSDCAQYLKTVGFLSEKDVHEGLLGRKSFGYIPILPIPSRGRERENLVSSFEDIFFDYMKVRKGSKFGLTVGYVLDELLANIWEHARSDYAYLHAQYYPGPEILEICLADRGIGITESYRNSGIKVVDDESALDFALDGQSSKSDVDGERGYGIPTVRRITTESECRGEFLILSGNTAHWIDPHLEKRYVFEDWLWQGTLLAIRMKKSEYINLYEYVENK